MSRFIIYIINPVSGTRSKKNLPELIEQKSREKNIPFSIVPSVADGNYDFLEPLIKEHEATDIVVAGGDGTIGAVVSSLKKYKVRFGIIPFGSGNGLAHTARIPKNPERAIDIILNGYSSAIDGFYVNEKFSCMLCGLGFDAQVAHDFAQQPRRGFGTYFRQTVRNFFLARSWTFKVTVGHSPFTVDAFFISIANSNQFGNHFTIAPKASLRDGLLDIVIVTRQNKVRMLLSTLKQVLGKNKLAVGPEFKPRKGVLYFQTEELSIQNSSGAPFHIDGDPAESPGHLEIRIIKHCFQLIQPPVKAG